MTTVKEVQIAAVTTAFAVLNDPATASLPRSEVGAVLSKRLQQSVASLGTEGTRITKAMILNIETNATKRETAEGVVSAAQTIFSALGDAAPAPFGSVFSILGTIAGVAQKVMANQKAVASLAERFISLNPIILEIHTRAMTDASDIVQSKSLDIVRRILKVFEDARDLIQRFVAPAAEEASDSKDGGGWFGSSLVRWAKEKFVEISHSPEDFELIHAQLDRVLADFNFAKIATLLPAPTAAELVEMTRVDAEVLQQECEARLKLAMKDASEDVKADIQRAQSQLTAEFKNSIGSMSAQLDTMGVMMKTMLQEKMFTALRLDEHEVRLFGKLANRTNGGGELLEASISGTTVVAKRSNATSESEALDVLNEADLLMQLQHPNIVRCYGVVVKGQRTYLLLERCNISVSAVLRMSGALPPVPAAFVLLKVSAALRTLHQRKHVHLDVNSHNVMLKSNGDVSLIDFGSAAGIQGASLTSSNKTKRSRKPVSPTTVRAIFVAPECVASSSEDVATVMADVYSFGMFMYELLSGGAPFDGDERDVSTIVDAVHTKKQRPSLTACARAPKTLTTLMQQCWAHEADDRPSMATVHGVLDQYLISEMNGTAASDEYNRFLSALGVAGFHVSAVAVAPTDLGVVAQKPRGTKQHKLKNTVARFRKFVALGKLKTRDYVAFLQELGRKGTTTQELTLFLSMHAASAEATSDAQEGKQRMDEAAFIKYFTSWLESVFKKIAAPREEVNIDGLKQFLEAIGKPQSEDSLPLLLQHVDVNVNGLLSFEELMVLVDSLYAPDDSDDEEEDVITSPQAPPAVIAPVVAAAAQPAVAAVQTPPPPLPKSDSADVKDQLTKALSAAKAKSREAVAQVLIDFAPPTIQSTELCELLMRAVNNAVVDGPASPAVVSAFTTLAARQALWSLAYELVADDAAGAYGAVTLKLAGTTVDQKKLFVSNPSRDALCAVALRATTAEFAGLVGSALSSLVADNDDQRKVFGTIVVRTAVTSLIRAAKASPKDLKTCLLALCNITINDDNEKLYGTPETAEILASVAAQCCSNAEVAEAFGNALRNLTVNEECKPLFNTTVMATSVAKVMGACTSSGSVRMICGAVSNLTSKERKNSGTEAIRNGLVAMAKIADSQIAIRFWANAVSNITVDDENEKLFSTEAMRDSVIMLAKKSTEALTVQWIATAIRNLSSNAQHKPLFGTPAVRDALLILASRADSPDAARFVCLALTNVAILTATKPLYGTQEVRTTFLTMSKKMTTPLAVRSYFATLATILVNDNNEAFFGIDAVRELFIHHAKLCSTNTDALQQWCLALRNFTVNVNNKKLSGTPEMRDALLTIMSGAQSAADVSAITKPLSNLNAASAIQNRKLFAIEIFRDALLRLAPLIGSDNGATASEGVRFYCSFLSSITVDDDSELLYGTTTTRDAFIKYLIPAALPGTAVANVAMALRNLCHSPPNKIIFSTPDLVNAALVLAGKVDNVEACLPMTACFQKIAIRPESRPLFCSLAARASFAALGKIATTPATAESFCSAIVNISIDNDCEAMYSSAELRDVLVDVTSLAATTAESAQQLAKVLSYVTSTATNRPVFRTKAVVDALTRFGPHIATPDGAHRFCSFAYNLIDDAMRPLFSNAAFRDIFANMAKHATTPLGAKCWALAVFDASNTDQGRGIFGTKAVLDAIVDLSSRITTVEEATALAKAVSTIARNDDSEKCFATPSLRDAILAHWIPHATTPECVSSVARAVTNISFAAPHKELMGTEAVRDGLLKLVDVPGNKVDAIGVVAQAMSSICGRTENVKIFSSVRDTFTKQKTLAENSGGEAAVVAEAVKHITALLSKLT
ncbi:serine-threonine protein kinase, putative [Bodo saltans]|uniref:Serine-threonine protein kinase, putative n=1 Tax=Bodo saltans TaxID=75058 RepID=A0A0S4JCZ2_BODSA|nr:serine-threonine protein kinase, putative [Bodo saltans]|eukprot:CUG87063.1 serine-threonine protein kinase, putative [Bodo saltans]